MYPIHPYIRIMAGFLLLAVGVSESAAQTPPAQGTWDLKVGPMRGQLVFVTSEDAYLDLKVPDQGVITEIYSYTVGRDGTISLRGREIHSTLPGLSPNTFHGKLSATGKSISDLRNPRDQRGNLATATWRNATIPDGWQKHFADLGSDRSRLYQLLSQNYSLDGRDVIVGVNPQLMSRLESSRVAHHRKLAVAYRQLVEHLDSFQGPPLPSKKEAEAKLTIELLRFAAGVNGLDAAVRRLMNSDLVQKPLEWRAMKVKHLALSQVMIASMVAEVQNQYSDRGKIRSRLAVTASVNASGRLVVSVKNPLPQAITNAYLVFKANYDGEFLDAAVRKARNVEYEPLVLALGVNLRNQTEAIKASTELLRANPRTPVFVPYLAARSSISTELPGPTGVEEAVESVDLWFGSDQVIGTGKVGKMEFKRGRGQ